MTTRFLLFYLLLILPEFMQAQNSNMVVFTKENQPFTLIVNGIQQNPYPAMNICITGLNTSNNKITVIFEQQGLQEIMKTINLRPETETTYEIVTNSKGIRVMRLLNSVPVDEAEEPAQNQRVYIYSAIPRLNSAANGRTTSDLIEINGDKRITATITQSSTTISTGNANEPGYQTDLQYLEDYPDYSRYEGPQGCHRPMKRSDFEQAITSISDKNFESSKLTVAKQVVATNCLLCKQVKEIMFLFTYEASKLEFAKYAYKFTWDINNYFILNDAFNFESSIEELNTYIIKLH